MSDERVNIKISTDTNNMIRAYAERREVTVGEAADRLIGTAIGRLEALERYGKAQSKERKAEEKAKRDRAKARKEALKAVRTPKVKKEAA